MKIHKMISILALLFFMFANGFVSKVYAESQIVNVTIDGKLQTFEQDALIINESTMVPMRAIFERLGATITWNQATSTVTGVKGDITIKLTIGNQTAFVNGKAVTLAAKPAVINGSTLVPLRFVAEALGAGVGWDANTTTAIITSKPADSGQVGSGQVVNGIKVQYGRHTYGNANQTEYDKSMEVVSEAISDIDCMGLTNGSENQQYFEDYLNGARWSGSKSDRSDRNVGLYSAEKTLGALVNNGVSKDTIVTMYKAALISNTLLKGTQDPRTGAPSSTYDALFRKQSDCDSLSQVYSAVYDSLGFNTMIVGTPGHTQMYVQANDKWFSVVGDTFTYLDTAKLSKPGVDIYSQPTDGSKILY